MSKKILKKVTSLNPKNLPQTKLDESLNLRAFSYTLGTLFGLIFFALTAFSINTGYGREFLRLMPSIYVGYEISWIGSIIGFLYGFLEGFICTYLTVYIYRFFNKFSKYKKEN